jgi:glutamate racemase
LKDAIIKTIGRRINIIDSAQEIGLEVLNLLTKKDILCKVDRKDCSLFYLTDIPFRFKETGRLFLGEELSNVKLIDI